MRLNILATLSSLVFLLLLSNVSIEAQCSNDTHSTNASDMWISCQMSTNPNPIRGNSHWIMYDLGAVYSLGMTNFWNYNVVNETDKGLKDIIIDYAVNDVNNWTNAGSFQLAEASGSPTYTGSSGLDMTNISARYILITGTSTWGNTNCAGLSEVRFEVTPSVCGILVDNSNLNPVATNIYYSNTEIVSDATVEQGMDVTFKAANAICLQPGFTVELGAEFLAIIETCNPSAAGTAPENDMTTKPAKE